MFQIEFQDVRLVEEATWKAVVRIPKELIKLRGVGQVEALCNTVMVILN